jgi:hypothetical protein
MKTSQRSALSVFAVLLHHPEEAVWLPAWSQSAGHGYQPVATPIIAFATAVLSVLKVALAVSVRRIPYLTVADLRCRRGDEEVRMRHAKSGRRSRVWQCVD